jgi:hypothetical protein
MCVRPDHLFLGTHADNAKDRNSKGRQAKGERTKPELRAKGERHASAKLTNETVNDIREIYPKMTLSAIARQFGVSKQAIWCVVHRITWKHV